MKRTVMAALISFLALTSAKGDVLKKISITRTNNAPYFFSSPDFVVSKTDASYLKKLKVYVEAHGFKPNAETEVTYVLSGLSWVNSQWVHDGMNQPPKSFRALDILQAVYERKEKYRCVEFGLVLSEVLQSSGFVTRTLAMRANDVAYGGFGKGHVAMEVWLNDLSKWIFLDGQFGAYLTRTGQSTPLNYYEIFEEKLAGRWAQLQVHFVNEPSVEKRQMQDYKDFLNPYFGHIAVSAGHGSPSISLSLESKEMPISFQGQPVDNVIFTHDHSVLYPEMNRVSILLNYREKIENIQEVVKKLHIETDADYLKNMASFAAVPKFTVDLKTSMPLFDKFEYRLHSSDAWNPVKGSQFDWNALEAHNKLEVRGVNQLGRAGPVTFLDLDYQ